MTSTEFSSAVTAITSAFGDPTRREIYLFVHQRPEGVTAGEVAERFALHANVARHHLDKLTAGGASTDELDRVRAQAVAGAPRDARALEDPNTGTNREPSSCEHGSPLVGHACAVIRSRSWPIETIARRCAPSSSASWPRARGYGRLAPTRGPATAEAKVASISRGAAPGCTAWLTETSRIKAPSLTMA